MAIKVYPAVLARSSTQLKRQWHLANDYSKTLHLDVADGSLTRQGTVTPRAFRAFHPTHAVEVHIMSKHPDQWLGPVLRLRTKRVILHVELGALLRPYLALFRTHRIPVALAINPSTPISRLRPWIKNIQGIQVMGVVPGQYGARWHPKTIARIKAIHRSWPRISISCDGGMRPATIPSVVRAGASTIIVGSFLQHHTDPDSAWRELRAATRAL